MSIVINKVMNIKHTNESNEPRQGQNILFTDKILKKSKLNISDAIGAKFSAPLINHDIV